MSHHKTVLTSLTLGFLITGMATSTVHASHNEHGASILNEVENSTTIQLELVNQILSIAHRTLKRSKTGHKPLSEQTVSELMSLKDMFPSAQQKTREVIVIEERVSEEEIDHKEMIITEQETEKSELTPEQELALKQEAIKNLSFETKECIAIAIGDKFFDYNNARPYKIPSMNSKPTQMDMFFLLLRQLVRGETRVGNLSETLGACVGVRKPYLLEPKLKPGAPHIPKEFKKRFFTDNIVEKALLGTRINSLNRES